MQKFVVVQGGDTHLKAEARDSTERLVEAQDFFDDGIGIADDEGACGAAKSFELAARDWGPAPFLADFCEGFCVTGEEVVGGLLVGVGDVAEGVDANFEFLGGMTGAVAGFAVEVDEGTEAVGFAADNGDHQRKAKHAGASEGFRGTTDA